MFHVWLYVQLFYLYNIVLYNSCNIFCTTWMWIVSGLCVSLVKFIFPQSSSFLIVLFQKVICISVDVAKDYVAVEKAVQQVMFLSIKYIPCFIYRLLDSPFEYWGTSCKNANIIWRHIVALVQFKCRLKICTNTLNAWLHFNFMLLLITQKTILNVTGPVVPDNLPYTPSPVIKYLHWLEIDEINERIKYKVLLSHINFSKLVNLLTSALFFDFLHIVLFGLLLSPLVTLLSPLVLKLPTDLSITLLLYCGTVLLSWVEVLGRS